MKIIIGLLFPTLLSAVELRINEFDSHLQISKEECDRLLYEYRSDASVHYQPGVDVQGRAVAPADLPGQYHVNLPQQIHIPIEIPLDRYMNRPQNRQQKQENIKVIDQQLVAIDALESQTEAVFAGSGFQDAITNLQFTSSRETILANLQSASGLDQEVGVRQLQNALSSSQEILPSLEATQENFVSLAQFFENNEARVFENFRLQTADPQPDDQTAMLASQNRNAVIKSRDTLAKQVKGVNALQGGVKSALDLAREFQSVVDGVLGGGQEGEAFRNQLQQTFKRVQDLRNGSVPQGPANRVIQSENTSLDRRFQRLQSAADTMTPIFSDFASQAKIGVVSLDLENGSLYFNGQPMRDEYIMILREACRKTEK